MKIERALQYAHCATALDADHETPGHAAIYDQALTNGLVAIVAMQWPGEEAFKGGKLLPALKLLDVIEEHSTEEPDGAYLLTWTETDGEPGEARINTTVLRHGVIETQPPRHARATGVLGRQHIDALLALDDHPALRSISEVESDDQWLQAHPRDLSEQQRAEKYLMFIGGDEAAERAERAPEHAEPYHPKHNPDRHGTDLEDCQVCGYSTFKLDAPAEFPDTGSGACLVCSYTRSPEVAYFLTLQAEFAFKLDL